MSRKDWDHVEFADYQRDMDALGKQANAVMATLLQKIEGLQRTMWLLIKAAGGRIEISHHDMVAFDRAHSVTTEEYRAETMGLVFTATLLKREAAE